MGCLLVVTGFVGCMTQKNCVKEDLFVPSHVSCLLERAFPL